MKDNSFRKFDFSPNTLARFDPKKNTIFEISREIFEVRFSFLKRRIELVNAVLSVNPIYSGVDFPKKDESNFHFFGKDGFNIVQILWPDLTQKNSIFEISREIFDVELSFLKRLM